MLEVDLVVSQDFCRVSIHPSEGNRPSSCIRLAGVPTCGECLAEMLAKIDGGEVVRAFEQAAFLLEQRRR